MTLIGTADLTNGRFQESLISASCVALVICGSVLGQIDHGFALCGIVSKNKAETEKSLCAFPSFSARRAVQVASIIRISCSPR